MSTTSDTGRPPASCCSRMCLCWPWPFIVKGHSRSLSRAAMPKLPTPLLSSTLVPVAFASWKHEQQNKDNPSILSVILRLHRFTFLWGVGFGSIQGFLNASARPLLLNYLIIAFTTDASPDSVALLLTVFGIIVLLEGWFKVLASNMLSTEFGAQILGWLIPLIHHKSARIRRIEPSEKKDDDDDNDEAGGDQTNRAATSEIALVSKDSLDTVQQFNWVSNFPQCVVGIVAGTATLIFLLGVPSIIGMVTMILSLSLNRLFATCGGRMAASEMAAGDMRLTVMREIVESIIPLKYLTWEEPYLTLIDRKREVECKWLYRIRLLTVTSVTIGRVSPVLAACATFTFMGLNGYPLTPNIIFASLATFNALRMPLITIPLNLIQLKTMAVSFRRITGFLSLEEHEKCLPPEISNVAVLFDNASFSWEKTGATTTTTTTTTTTIDKRAAGKGAAPFKLDNIQLTVRTGHLVGIVGRVGCGKSTLLSSLLGEVQLTEGKVYALSDIGYVPQKPFVLSGTVLENIMMGRDHDDLLLQNALLSSDFHQDLQRLPGGLETEIGERGMTLSGGQKQRLAIARAVYSRPELLIVDDALAAVDGKVATRIFQAVCDERKISKLTTIVALNQLSFLPKFDLIVFLVEGVIHDQGTYDELLSRCELFKTMVSVTGGESLDDVESPAVATSSRKILGGAAGGGLLGAFNAPVDAKAEDVVLVEVKKEGDEAEKKQEGEEIVEEIVLAELEEEEKREEVKKQGVETAEQTNASRTSNTNLREAGRLVDDDERRQGALDGEAIRYYIKAAGGWWWLSGACLLGICAYGQMSATDLWLAAWVSPNNTLSTLDRAGVYVGLSLGQSIAVWSLSMWNNCASNRASRAVHHDCIDRLLHAPSSWFQKTPSGRILSRFSGDMAMMDKMFAYIMDDILQFTFLLLGLIVTICFILPEMIAILLAGLTIYGFGVVAIDRTNREAKREANLALSPVLTTLAETISGRSLIHAMGFENFFEQKEQRNTEKWSRFTHFSNSTVQSGVMLTNVIAFVFSMAAAILVYVQRNRFPDIALIGVALNYSFVLPYFLGLYSILTMLLFNGVTAVERVLDFITGDLPQESAWILPSDPDRGIFPKTGQLEFQDVSLRYRKDLPDVIRHVTCTINDGETVGIVGRTGAGKSSLIVGLFRIVDHPLMRGRILIDGVDLGSIGLQTARRALAIIPQTPLLLTPGSIGHNIDPFNHHGSEKIEECMVKVGLEPTKIDMEACELSAGQQQLLALARLLLFDHVPRVIIMDEPTANIDSQTDEVIQNVIRTEFAGITMLTVAHRLNTVIGCDKMIVMDAGIVAEMGTPLALLTQEGGRLSKMVAALGEETAMRLRDGANVSQQKKMQ